MPQGWGNNDIYKTYFSTYATTDSVDVSSLSASVTIRDNPDGGATSLEQWLTSTDQTSGSRSSFAAESQPWLGIVETGISAFSNLFNIMPPTLQATAFSSDVNLDGTVTLAPSPTGNIQLIAAGSINGFQPNSVSSISTQWGSSEINLSDADPTRFPRWQGHSPTRLPTVPRTGRLPMARSLPPCFCDSRNRVPYWAIMVPSRPSRRSTRPESCMPGRGPRTTLRPWRQHLRRDALLRQRDPRAGRQGHYRYRPVHPERRFGGCLGRCRRRGIILYDPSSPLREEASSGGNELPVVQSDQSGTCFQHSDGLAIFKSTAGNAGSSRWRKSDTGRGSNDEDGTAVGITSIGNARNPYLPFGGASIVAAAGVDATGGLSASSLDFSAFVSEFLEFFPWNAIFQRSCRLRTRLGGNELRGFLSSLRPRSRTWLRSIHSSWSCAMPDATTTSLAAPGTVFTPKASRRSARSLAPAPPVAAILTSPRERSKPKAEAISAYWPRTAPSRSGSKFPARSRSIRGLSTDDGGNINIYTGGDVNVGTSRIFTLRGGNEIIWSTNGSIDAGASSKTVQSAPPTRVIVDPQSADVDTDLAGLATGGGIGVLAAVVASPRQRRSHSAKRDR